MPGYSEVYPVEDLVWDNTNKALDYREDILNLHRLDDDELADLVERLEESQLDNYTDIRTLIGIEFDENTVWGQLTILELKLLVYLARITSYNVCYTKLLRYQIRQRRDQNQHL